MRKAVEECMTTAIWKQGDYSDLKVHRDNTPNGEEIRATALPTERATTKRRRRWGGGFDCKKQTWGTVVR